MADKPKKILYTQRVEVIAGYNERRDCADQQIAAFLWACGFAPVPVNNLPERIEQYVEILQPEGIVLTGGNDLAAYDGNAPERDAAETKLIDIAMQQNIPLLGFCRGMQMLASHFGGKLIKVSNHVAQRHLLQGQMAGREVNSYHNYAVADLPADFEELAWTEGGILEAMRHKQWRLMGIMWHPEREQSFCSEDMALFQHFFA